MDHRQSGARAVGNEDLAAGVQAACLADGQKEESRSPRGSDLDMTEWRLVCELGRR